MPGKVELNRAFYNRQWYASWKARFMYDPVSKQKIAHQVLKEAGFRDGNKSVLDIGFGFGLILLSFERSDNIVGIEISESSIMLARDKAKKRGFVNARFCLYPGSGKIPFPDNSFDLVICSHVLEHVPDDNFLLCEMHRLMKPGSMALVNIPINEELFDDPRHVRKYKPGLFLKQVEEHGFKVIYLFQGDRLWSVFGWFFEKGYHNKIPVLGFAISSTLNVLFSLWPFKIQIWLEERFLKQFKPRQFAVCARKYMS